MAFFRWNQKLISKNQIAAIKVFLIFFWKSEKIGTWAIVQNTYVFSTNTCKAIPVIFV